MAYFRKRNPNRQEVVDPCDVPINEAEALAVARIAGKWPGGLGEALVPCETTKRKWKRDPNFDVFNPSYTPGEDVLLCPVMEVKRLRALPNLYHHHLSVWRSLRNVYAETLNLTLKEAHDRYNSDLKNDPKALEAVFLRYAQKKQSLSGTKRPSWYVLYELVDDFGNYITPPELQNLDGYLSRHWFFNETDTLGEQEWLI